MNFEIPTSENDYVYLGQQCKLSVRDAHAKNYALALNKSPHRYVKVDNTQESSLIKSTRTKK
jgi:hypothetical protein